MDGIGAGEVVRLLTALGDDLFVELARDLGGPVLKQLADDLGEAGLKKIAQELGGPVLVRLHTDMATAVFHQTSLLENVGRIGLEDFIALVKSEGASALVKYGGDAIRKYGKAALDQGASASSAAIAAGQLQKKWKHAVDFGITSSWKAGDTAAHAAYRDAVDEVVAGADMVFAGAYHGFDPAFHYFLAGKVVITDAAGNFISGWANATGKLAGIRAASPPTGFANFRVR